MTYKIIIAGFFVQNKLKKVKFFKETFLLADTTIKVVLKMFSLIFSNVDIWLIKKELE